jgi:urease gamma subunit
MNAPVAVHRAALPDLIERARACLGDGDLEAARLLSARAYDTARQATAYAKRFEASEQLLRKAHVLQGEALLIEAEVQIAIADMIDAGQKAGLISKGGRPKGQNDNAQTVPGADLLHLDDFRIAKQRLAEARALRDAERAEPGLAERAIRARLDDGQEPTRASLRAAIGTRSASKEERGDNFYQTPAEAIGALLALERFGPVVWEPACGLGAIAGPLEAAGYDVILSDLRDRGCADRHGEVQATVDFLDADRAWLVDFR